MKMATLFWNGDFYYIHKNGFLKSLHPSSAIAADNLK